MCYGQIIFVTVAALATVIPSVWSRKCYTCSSMQNNPSCADGYQTGSMQYVDCSTQGGYNQQGAFPGQPGGFPGQQPGMNPQFPQAQGQYGYGNTDRCFKMTVVGGGPNGQPVITRGCGTGGGPVMSSSGYDTCTWMGSTQVCSCDSNYCNGSSRLSSTTKSAGLIIALLTFLISMMYRKTL